MFNAALKPFMINGSDIDFITTQVNFRPLFDVDGNAIIAWDGTGAIYDGYGKQVWDGTGLSAAQAQATYGTSYDTAVDLTGTRYVSGQHNNLVGDQYNWGSVDQNFARFAASYGNYLPALTSTDTNAFAAAKTYWKSYSNGVTAGGFNLNGNANTDYSVTASATGNHVATDGTQIQINNIVDYTPRMISLLTTTGGVTYDTWANHQSDPNAAHHTANEIYYDANGVAAVTSWGALDTVANGGEGQIDSQAHLNASAGQDDHFIGTLNPGVSPSNGFFVLFGQFFDHGLDFIDKSSGANIKIALAADDPLYGMTGPDGRPVHEITINRATVQTIDANGTQYVDHTSPYIDQSQTYGSHDAMTNLLREWTRDPVTGQFHAGMSLFDGNTLETAWTKADGTVTHETLPTLAELRAHVAATGRDDLSWEDISNLRNRDAQGHVIAGTSGSAVLLDMNPRFDIGHLHGFYDKNGSGTQDAGEASYATSAQAAQVDAAIATLDAKVKVLYGPGVSFGIVNGQLTLSGLPGPQPVLTGANALYPFVDFSNFSIKTTDTITHQDISGVHDAVGQILLASVSDHYIAGDGRVNENFGLTSIHHIFHEEHNFQVQNLIDALHRDAVTSGDLTNLHTYQIDTGHQNAAGDFITQNGDIAWNTDKVFAGVKVIVEMEYQHSAVDQYARNVSPNIQEFVGYSAEKNAAVTLEFAQGAFRFGHSQLRETIDAIDPTKGLTGKIMGYALEQAFLSPEKYAGIGPSSVLLGMTHQQANEIDEFITPALNQGLLGQPLDLAAINIARGRDIGLPDLNTLRTTMGLQTYGSWTDFGQNMQHPSSLANFIAAYSLDGNLAKAQAIVGLADGSISEEDDAALGMTVDQANTFLNGGDSGYQHIDAWLGGLAEVHQPGGLLGETFDKIFVDQIESLMDGDRFYYLYRLAGQQFGEEVANSQLKDIVERNTGLTHLNGNVFGYADQYVDLGATKEVVAAGQEAQTTGNEHKYGDIANVANGTIGIYSNGGRNNVNDGRTVTIKGVQYLQDTRLEDGNTFARPTVTSGKFTTDLTGWTKNGDASVVTLDSSLSAVKGHGGGAVADLANGGTLTQELSALAVKGDEYTLTVNVGDRTDNAPGKAYVSLSLVSPDGTITHGLGMQDIDTTGDGSWQKVVINSGVIDAQHDGWKLVVELVGGINGGHNLFDDVAITQAHQVLNDGVNLDGTPNSGADSNEVIAGTAGNDLIYGLGGDDTLYGDGGNDTLYGGYGIDRLYGGAGADKIYGGDNPDLIDGGSGDDQLYGESSGSDINGMDQIIGGSGNDVIHGGIGIDKLSAGSGDDKVYGDQDTDPFTHAGDGNDYVDGGSGQDILYGDNGSDLVVGGSDSDQLFGGKGDDILRPGDATGATGVGTDEVLGGDGTVDVGDKPGTTGFDLIDFSDNAWRKIGVSFDLSNQNNPLAAPNGNLAQVGSAQIEGVIGSRSAEALTGDDGNNWIIGGAGRDTLIGGAGNDVIVGGSIRLDTLIGKYNSGYTHNNANAGLTDADQLEDARYQGASHRVLWSETIDNSGLIDAVNSTGGAQFEKHFTEMLRSDQFKDLVLGNSAGVANTGTDTVVYAGNRDDYQITRVKYNGVAAFKVVGTGSANSALADAAKLDGTDLVVNVSKFQFADMTVSANNLVPIIDSNGGKATGTATVDENTTAVTTVHASDAAVGGPVTYSITGGADAAKFAINAQTGALTFVAAPNFEAPTDTGTNNVYDVIVQATDGFVSGQQSLAVTVNNVDEAATGGVNLTITAGANLIIAQDGTVGITSTLADPDLPGGLTLSHQWQTSTNNGSTWTNVPLIGNGATLSSALSLSQNGKLIRDVVSYTDPFGTKSVTSAQVAIVGTVGNNTLTGTAGADVIHGLDGNDTITGNAGDDVIIGGKGNDTLTGSAGADTFLIGTGEGTDTINGGTESDTIQATANNVVITLASGFGSANSIETISSGGFTGVTVTGGTSGSTLDFSSTTLSGISAINGTAGNDTITGSSVNNTIVGGAGNDRITGGGGNDTMTGGAGSDTLTGGVGSDVFVFTALSESQSYAGRDIFTDLTLGSDTVRFGAGLGTVGAQAHDVYTVVTASGAITTDATLATAVNLTAAGNSNGGKVVIVNDTTTSHAFVVVDTNNTSGYQTGVDMVFEVNHTITGTIPDFII
ncbi:peroxidase family protein [Novosphingobium sp. PASSN1]|uniref:peroxidase family protein n=1 Tax=Novosphingobium sp. PASSN1 TaxID=2015561 RepID=UPI000BCDE3B8|nr:peroxidase family protein [Novosphingobium sp. PASSN1]OYU35683.1 MAG: heme peroxidase [Novosphingobium sp. PASSN1]